MPSTQRPRTWPQGAGPATPSAEDRRLALRFALFYAVFGAAWVFGTDLVAEQLAADEAQLRVLSTWKGWFFVLVSTGLVYVLARSLLSSRARALSAARRGEHRFRALMENAPDMVFWLADPDLRQFHYVGPALETLWGCSPEDVMADASTLLECIHPDDHDVVEEGRRAVRVGEPFDIEYRIEHPSAGVRWMRTQGYPIRDASAGLEGVAGVTSDVTRSKRALGELRRSEEMHRRAQRIAHIGHWELDPESGRLAWSEEVYRIFGVDPAEFEPTYERFLALVHPDDRAAQRAADAGALAGGEALDLENRIVRPDGVVRYVHERGGPQSGENGSLRFVGTIQDVTRRRRIQAELERSRELLRRYAAARTSDRERERIALAREIHDQVGQLLTVVKLQLTRELRDAADGPRERLEQTVDVVNSALREVRDISSRLRPPALDQLGVVDALAAHVDQFARQADIRASFSTDFEHLPMDAEAATHLFRIAQEALTNVARHAQARHVEVEVRADDGAVVLRVHDDGVGLTSRTDGHGVMGMRERALLLDGDLKVSEPASGGTEVRVRIPHPEGAA